MKPLFTFVRFCPPLYKFLYVLYINNHENKLLKKGVANLLKILDRLFLFLPGFFIFKDVFFPEVVVLQDMAQSFFLNPFYSMFSASAWIFTIVSIMLFITSKIFINSCNHNDIQKKFTKTFHFVNHRYRNFIDDIVQYKNINGLFSIANKEHMKLLEAKYTFFIDNVCLGAQRVMREIIDDPDCYIGIKLLKDGSSGKLILNHYNAYPDNYPGSYLTGVELVDDIIDDPANLFQAIINEFNAHKKRGNYESWDLGKIYNDLKGQSNFDSSLINHNFSRYNACIILSIAIDCELVGFMYFNTKKLAALRNKHLHFIAGHCDQVANIMRNITDF